MKLNYFDISEFDCSETGENLMQPNFLKKLDQLRSVCGFPFVITSGYRAKTHSIEARKPTPGMHTFGCAADIAVSNGHKRFLLVQHAIDLGFTGIGVDKDFIHVDTRRDTPVIWVY